MRGAGSRGERRTFARGVAVLAIGLFALGACGGGGGGGGDSSEFADNALYRADIVNCKSRDATDGETNTCTSIVDCMWTKAGDGQDAISQEQWTQIETSIWGPQSYGIAAMRQTRHAHLTSSEAEVLKRCDVDLEGSTVS
jgi:hypothetical protein